MTDRHSKPSRRVGFVGLGAMGFGMASHLVKSGFEMCGFDVAAAQAAKLSDLGGMEASSAREAAATADVFVVVVANAAQADTVFFDLEEGGAALSLPRAATIMLCSTVPPAYYASLTHQLAQAGRADVRVVDAPISGGATKAGLGQLTILTAGAEDALSSSADVTRAMAEKIYRIPGDLGAASSVKMINQLLAGINIAAAAEAMAFAARLKLNTRSVFEEVNASSSWSWMFENRVAHMLDNDWDPKSALDIFVKDMVRKRTTRKGCNIETLIIMNRIRASSQQQRN